ncbi:DUF1302 family protein [Oleomonas cavernae]|uniref:DUF1302 family protein n=1 Tax=Oleomonas cavernae TaxID=2320859 RepID=A0A418WFJ2_9PROT|nr:DUF1302 family protein [Oleomonas cavernae]RJF88787.1 DUF1302 family protein [Oleomonas cavernae]
MTSTIPAARRRGLKLSPASCVSAAAMAALLLGTSALAYEFEMGDELTGTIITTLSVGAQMRMADRDPRNVGYSNGGRMTTSDSDDGNLNYDKYDLTSQVTTITSEMRLKWRNYFGVLSGTAFFDSIAANNDLAVNGPPERPYRGEYSPEAKDYAAWDAEFREYYVGGNFSLFDRTLTVKAGSQILNWGEAFFTLNGISVINAFDVNKVLSPGAELKDALIPTPMIDVTYEVAEGLTAEAFYTLDFEAVRLPACGAFLSFNDNICRGAEGTSAQTDYGDTRAYTVGRDDFADYDTPPYPYGSGPQAVSVGIPILTDDETSGGSFGASLRYFSPDLNNTEFQFYYANYRSTLPGLYFKAPETYANGTGELNLTQAVPGLLNTIVTKLGVEQQELVVAALKALDPTLQLTGDLLTDLTDPVVSPLLAQLLDPSVGTLPRSVVFENMDGSAIYKYYPDNVQMLGFAFSTTESSTGIAINGELSFKHGVPVIVSGPLFLTQALNQLGGVPLDNAAYGAQLGFGPITGSNFGIAPYIEGPGGEFDGQQIPGRVIYGSELHNVWQAALRFTKIFGGTDLLARVTGANSIIGLVEFGGIHVDLNEGTPYAAYGQTGFTDFYARSLTVAGMPLTQPVEATSQGFPFVPTGHTPSQWSGGVQGIFFFEYPDLIGDMTVTPSIAFSTGLFGITPTPLPGFVKGMTSLMFSVKTDITQQFSVTANFLKSFGAGGGYSGSRNPFIDRDFVGVVATYQF